MITNKELIKQFIDFEYNNDLFEWECSNIPIWELIRFEVFIAISKQCVKQSYKISDIKFKTLLVGLINYLNSGIWKRPKVYNKQTDLLILNHPRRKLINNFFEDIYVDSFISSFDGSYIILEKYFNLTHLKPVRSKNINYLDFLEFPSRFANLFIFKNQLNKKEVNYIQHLEAIIQEQWNVSINLENRVIKTIKRYKFLFPKLLKLFKEINPKIILNVVSYQIINQIFTIIAKENKIPVVELQHGTVGRYHIGYNYPENVLVKSFPDYFLAWGSFWTDYARMPILRENIKKVGFPYIENFTITEVKGKIDKQILVISQMRKDLVEFTIKIADLLPDYHILFKLHPQEYNRKNDDLSALELIENVNLINKESTHLYQLFNESQIVLGVSSTALIEALAFNSNIVILKLPGWEYFEDMKETENFRFISNIFEFENFIKVRAHSNNEIKLNNYFENNSINKILGVINNLR